MTARIKMAQDDEADGELLDVLKLAHTLHGTLDNVMRVFPAACHMRGHVSLYRAALHGEANRALFN